MTDVIKYTLKSPVNLSSGVKLTEVTLREPEVGDMIAVEDSGGGETARVAHLLARMCDMDRADFALIKSRDAQAMKAKADKKWGNEEQDGGKSPS